MKILNKSGEKVYMISPTEEFVVKKGTNFYSEDVWKKVQLDTRQLMELQGLKIEEEKKAVIVQTEKVKVKETTLDFSDMNWSQAVAFVKKCKDKEYLESLLETETRQSVKKAILKKIGD